MGYDKHRRATMFSENYYNRGGESVHVVLRLSPAQALRLAEDLLAERRKTINQDKVYVLADVFDCYESTLPDYLEDR